MKLRAVFISAAVAAIGWKVGSATADLLAKAIAKKCTDALLQMEEDLVESTDPIVEVNDT